LVNFFLIFSIESIFKIFFGHPPLCNVLEGWHRWYNSEWRNGCMFLCQGQYIRARSILSAPLARNASSD
jgi:hypothetical protein